MRLDEIEKEIKFHVNQIKVSRNKLEQLYVKRESKRNENQLTIDDITKL